MAHALPSAYWAFGGGALVDTVGTWARQWRDADPFAVGAALLLIAAIKAVVAWAPWLLHRHWSRAPGWRPPAWAAALGLTAYGLLNTLGAWAVLSGVVPAAPGTEHAALLGHALLWDPLFLLWGLCLAFGLRASSRERRAAVLAVRAERLALAHR